MRCVARRGLQGFDNHCLDHVIADASRCATARLVQQTSHAFSNVPRAPLANRGVGQAQLARHLAIRTATTTAQHNFRSDGREFPSGRCLIPADGFYEFTDPKDKKKTDDASGKKTAAAGDAKEGAPLDTDGDAAHMGTVTATQPTTIQAQPPQDLTKSKPPR